MGKNNNRTDLLAAGRKKINKWVAPVPSSTSQVCNLRNVNNDQVAIAVDMNEAGRSQLEDEDDDKVHGFKSLSASKLSQNLQDLLQTLLTVYGFLVIEP